MVVDIRDLGIGSVKEEIRPKTAIFGQKTLILALFDPFFKENFQ